MNSVDNIETKSHRGDDPQLVGVFFDLDLHRYHPKLLRFREASMSIRLQKTPQELQDLHTLSNETTHLESKSKV